MSHRDRVRMDAGARRWLLSAAQQNLWRIASWYDFDDLVQDGMLLYYHVCERYPEATDPRHIMRLFQRTFLNHCHNLSRKQRVKMEVVDTDFVQHHCTAHDHFADLLLWLAEAPDEVRRLLQALIRDGWKMDGPYAPSGRRETTNERLCALVGADHNSVNLHRVLRSYLGGAYV